ncbi:MAG: 3-methyl-2-oxobutanoate dehydrogenase (2-methylpropanoyl-transferring) subunit alpha, partial [Pseudomonadota bacterium]|nr:3-methyl-2-oxobutanoate dehydrogenase (2-methylpropanoyl-transferring) subunit alpha [Pseudomonadota bacterium]
MSDPHGSAGGEGQAGRNLPPLRLHVPEPPARPGEAADFTHFDIPAAGAQPRPDETAQPGEMRDMAYGLVRVLDEEGRAAGPWDPRLPAETLLRMLRYMALTRAFDARMFR